MKNFFKKFIAIFLACAIINPLAYGNYLPIVSAQTNNLCSEWELVEYNWKQKCKVIKETIYRNNYEFRLSPSGMWDGGLKLFNNWVYQDINLNFATFFYSGNNRRSRKIGVELYSGWAKKLNENISLFSFLDVPAGGKEYILAGLGDDTFSVKIDGRILVNESGSQAYGSLKLYPIFLEEWEHLIEFSYNNTGNDGGLVAEIIGEFNEGSFLNPNGTVKVANIVEHFGRSPSTSWRDEWTAVTAPVNWTNKIKWNSRQYLSTGADKNNVISQNYGHTCETGYEVLFEKTGLTYSKTPVCVKYIDPNVIPATGNIKPAGYVEVEFRNDDNKGTTTGELRYFVKPGVAVTVPYPAVTAKDGYVFNTWATVPSTLSAGRNFVSVSGYSTLFSVDFKNEDDILIDTQKVREYSRANQNAVTAPTKVGHTFLGWSKDGINIFNFNTAITENITLKPLFERNNLTVTFEWADGQILSTKNLKYWENVNSDWVTATKSGGFRFVSWQKDGIDFDFSAPITENITLTPKFEEIPKTGVILNEVAYRVNGVRDWVELYNPTNAEIDLSGFVLKDGTDGTTGYSDLVFPAGTKIRAGQYLTFANEDFSEKYGTAPSVIKNSSGLLDLWHTEWGGKEYFVSLSDNYNRELDKVTWTQGGRLPGGAVGRDNQNICRIENVWKNTCQQTPNAVNSENTTTISFIFEEKLPHNITGSASFDYFLLSRTNIRGEKFTYKLSSSVSKKLDNDKFEITGESISLKNTETTNYFTKPTYSVEVEVFGDRGTYGKTTLTIQVIEPKFSVRYNYIIDSDANPEIAKLPESFDGNYYKPAVQTNKTSGATVRPENPPRWDTIASSLYDGTWVFTGWDATEKVVGTSDVEFIGKWRLIRNQYNVNFSFEKADGVTENLPQAVLEKLPTEITGKINAEKIAPTTLTFPDVPVSNGTWTFAGWDENTKTINKANVHFIGKWNFEYKDAKISYNFIAKDTDKVLPNLDALKPDEKNVKFSQNISPENPRSETYVDAENDGIWNFAGYKNPQTIVDEEVEAYVGEWAFTANKHKVSHTFVSGTSGKNLPAIEALTDIVDKVKGDNVEPVKKIFENISDAIQDGTWTFAGWNPDKIRMENADAVFTGTWTFTPNTYKATFAFEKADGVTKELPAEIFAQLPVEITGKTTGEIINAESLNFVKNFPKDDVTWSFVAWDENAKTINKANVHFVGKWNFEYKDATISYNFIAKNTDKILPNLDALKPDEKIAKFSQNITAENPKSDTFVDEAQDGIWTFAGYNNSPILVDSETETFIWEWTFTPKKHKVSHKFVSGTAGKTLPTLEALADITDKVMWNNVEPIKKIFDSVADTIQDGIWTFAGWNPENITIGKTDAEFVGTWNFSANNYIVDYSFTTTSGKTFPQSIVSATPRHLENQIKGTPIVFPDVITPVTDAENDGIWTFEGWDKSKMQVEKSNVTVFGNWTFTPNTYEVTHTFIAKNTDKSLPQAIKDRLPAKQIDKINANNVTPTENFEKNFIDEVNDGTWTFEGWDAPNKTINKANVNFEGSWTFKANEYTATFTFENFDNLPEEIKNLLNNEQPKKGVNGAKITPTNNTFANVTITDTANPANTGTWRFRGWDKREKIFEKSDLTFTGKWEFRVKKATIKYFYTENVDGRDLPAALTPPSPHQDDFGTTTIPSLPDTNFFDEWDGRWGTDGFLPEEEFVDKDVEIFTAEWFFTPKKWKVVSSFYSHTNGRNLPNEVLSLLTQEEKDGIEMNYWTTITPKTFADVEVATGTWKLTGSDVADHPNNNEFMDQEEELIYYYWQFSPKPAKIISEFKSATSRELPDEVKNLLPAEKNVFFEAENNLENFANISLATGTWSATGANEDGDNIVNKDIEKNIYTWTFTPKNSKIIYHFESADATPLPAEINAFKPNEKPTTFEATENAQNPTQTTHEVENGTWNFVAYDETSLTVDEEIETFTGKWKFTPSIVTDETEKLPNFVKIIFTIPENKGTSADTKIFFVNPTKNISLTAPNVTDKTGYTFKNWDKNTTGTFTENTEIIAIFDSTNIEVEEKTYNVSLATNGEIDIPDSAENFVKNLQNLPAGTTFAWKDGTPKINKNNVGPRDFTIIAKIPGEADKEIAVRINFNDDIKPDMSDIPDSIEAFVGDEINKRFEISDNNGSPLSEAKGLFPGLNYDGDQHVLSANIPLDTVPKEYEITISATDDFGNIGTKTIKVKIKPLTEKFLPEAEKKVVEVKTPLDQISPKNSIKNADDLPTGTDFAWDMPPALDEVANDVPASVKITYPDGSAENITVSFDIVDTKKPTIVWEKNISHPVGSENAKNFDPLSGISVNDNFYQNLTPNCSVNPAYDATKIGTYVVACDVTDPSNNTAETFTRTIEITKIDKQKLIDLLQKITDDFNNRPDKITNPTADDEAKNALDTAIKNDNLSLEDLEKIFEKYKDIQASRDETAPTGEITADKTDWINTDVTLTLTTDKPVATPNGWTQKDADGKIFEKILTANENISVNFTDNYGNSGTATKNIENIDKIAPICGDFTHSPTTPTRGNVIFTMANMSDALSGLADGQNFTCEVTENGQKCSINIVDKAGNTQTCESPVVVNIDRVAPKLTLSADNTNPTNGNVTITLTSDEPMETPNGWTKVDDTTFRKIFENNENVSVTARDTAGNESTATINISNIDKTPPSGEVTGNPTNWTNNNVTLTLKTTKPVETPNGWARVNDTTFTKDISENQTGNVVVTDKVGNTSVNISYNVSKIDKEKPVVTTLSVEWDKTLIQSASVKVNVAGNDTGGSEIKNFECKLNNGAFVPCASEFTFDNLVEWENTISVRVIDNAGNISDVKNIAVTKDSTAPNFTNLTNKEFDEDKNISEIIFTTDGNNDEISVVSALPTGLSYDRNAKKITGIPTEPGVYQVSVEATDKAGNKKADTFTITILDKTAPEITLNTAPTTLVKWQNYSEAGATCTDNFDTTCSVQISGNVDSDVVWDYTITYTATDKAGNTATKTRIISVVSGETPIITLLWDADVVVELGSTYADAGATAADQEDGNISPNIVTENLVNANVLGDYEVKYNITDSSGNKAPEVKRLVRVVDTTAPKIENISDQIFDEKSLISPIKIEVSDLNPVINISVENLPNGLVYNETSKQIEGTPTEISEKIVKIIAIDGSGNKMESTFVIKITDIEKPIISGQDSFTFFSGSSEAKNFDPFSGIIATDNNDADIQNHLKCEINPQYNPNNAGRFMVTCDVTDAQGNKAENFTRTIILEQRTVSGPGGGYTGGGNNAGGSSGDSVITPVTSNTPQNPTPQNIPQNPKNDIKPQITDILPTQNISPTDKTLNNQKIFKVNNRITDYICEEIVQAYDYPSLKFVDNPRNKTFHDDISALAMFRGLEKDEMNLGQTYLEYRRHGVVLNVAKFEPNRNVTRAEFVKMLVRSLSCRYTFMGTDTGFKDISGDEWHAEYIKFAVENGWVNGYADGNFRPNAPITRAEAAKILSRSIQLATNNQTTTNFRDIPNNSEFIPYIETLKNHGIMKGRNATTFAPDAHIPRTETSRIIYRTFFGGTH